MITVTRQEIKNMLIKYDSHNREDSRRTSIISHHIPGQETVWYVVISPGVGQKDFYRQALSKNAFYNREIERIFGSKAENNAADLHQYCSLNHDAAHRLRDWEFWDKYAEANDIDNTGIVPETFILIESIWKFYDAVKYDFKKKKYIQ